MMYFKKHLKTLLFSALLFFSTFVEAKTITGVASWYGHPHHGRKTASGERYNMYGLSAAHRSIKLGTRVKVTNLKNKKSVILKINDRGPYAKGRIIDLSLGAKRALDMDGTTLVSVEIIN